MRLRVGCRVPSTRSDAAFHHGAQPPRLGVMAIWVEWVREGELARSPRPGYAPGMEGTVTREAVERWAAHVRGLGVASIICLLDRDQLPLYDRTLPGGLLRFYQEAGFAVAHIPTPDGLMRPFTAAQLERAWESFLRLPKPVLVHCSAGHDRTGRVVTHILNRLSSDED